MEYLADVLLVGGALGAGVYCFVLARRLAKFNDLENGVGGAVAVLSAQVDDLTKTLEAAQKSANASTESLGGLTERAEGVAQRLELLVASMHDLPGDAAPKAAGPEQAPKGESEPRSEQESTAEPVFMRRPPAERAQ